MLDEHAVRAVIALAALDELAQHLLRHRQVGTVVDARDGLPILLAAHHAEKLRLRALARLEHSLGGLDGFFAEDEDGWHGLVESITRMATNEPRIQTRMADGA